MSRSAIYPYHNLSGLDPTCDSQLIERRQLGWRLLDSLVQAEGADALQNHRADSG